MCAMSNVCSYDLAESWGQHGSAEVVAGPWAQADTPGAAVIAFPRPKRRPRPRLAVVLVALGALALLVLLALPIRALGGQTLPGGTAGGAGVHGSVATSSGGPSAQP